jgi:L-asparaginase/Glu-tRNA(Gln) amidotransferase subunit D
MNHNLKGTIVAAGEGTIPSEVKAALDDAAREGISVIYTTTNAPAPVVLQLRPQLPELSNIKRYDRKTPNQPWYTRFRKDKR